jgi:hypothetical protein
MSETTTSELLRVDSIVQFLHEIDAAEYGTEALAMTQATFSDYNI